jgi:hypothetical protein
MKGKWTHDRDGVRESVSRKDLMLVMQNLVDIMIRATYDENMIDTYLTMVEMEYGSTTADSREAPRRATWVEKCECPANYVGTSCERCANGFTRRQTGSYLGVCESEGILSESNVEGPFLGLGK